MNDSCATTIRAGIDSLANNFHIVRPHCSTSPTHEFHYLGQTVMNLWNCVNPLTSPAFIASDNDSWHFQDLLCGISSSLIANKSCRDTQKAFEKKLYSWMSKILECPFPTRHSFVVLTMPLQYLLVVGCRNIQTHSLGP
jgi:hypothetical protein